MARALHHSCAVRSVLLSLAVLLAACGPSMQFDVWAINPTTGEVRGFAAEGDVPPGWLRC